MGAHSYRFRNREEAEAALGFVRVMEELRARWASQYDLATAPSHMLAPEVRQVIYALRNPVCQDFLLYLKHSAELFLIA